MVHKRYIRRIRELIMQEDVEGEELGAPIHRLVSTLPSRKVADDVEPAVVQSGQVAYKVILLVATVHILRPTRVTDSTSSDPAS